MSFQCISVPKYIISSQDERVQAVFLKNVRENLKQELISKRRRMFGHYWMAYCPVCNDEKPNELHEVWITRGMAKGMPFGKYIQIFAKENCSVIHGSPCHIRAQHEPLYKWMCKKDILLREGREDVLAWALYMHSNSKIGFQEVINDILEVGRNMFDIISVMDGKILFKIAGRELEKLEDLETLSRISRADCRRDDSGIYTLVHPEKYDHIKFVHHALEAMRLQIKLPI